MTGRHQVVLLGVLHSPADAAELLVDLEAFPGPTDPLGFPREDREASLHHAKTIVGRLMASQGQPIITVTSQKDLNALAGYFWVEPRRLP